MKIISLTTNTNITYLQVSLSKMLQIMNDNKNKYLLVSTYKAKIEFVLQRNDLK